MYSVSGAAVAELGGLKFYDHQCIIPDGVWSWLTPSPSNYTPPSGFKFSDITLVTWNHHIYTKAMKKMPHIRAFIFRAGVPLFRIYSKLSRLYCVWPSRILRKRHIQDSFEDVSLYVRSLKPHPPWLWYQFPWEASCLVTEEKVMGGTSPAEFDFRF